MTLCVGEQNIICKILDYGKYNIHSNYGPKLTFHETSQTTNSKKQHQKLGWSGGKNTTMSSNLYDMVAVRRTETDFSCFHAYRYGHITAWIRTNVSFYAHVKNEVCFNSLRRQKEQ